jgi:hypothetical protein
VGTANYAAAKFLEIFEILPTKADATVVTAGGALVLEVKHGSTYPLDKFALAVALEKRFAAGFIKGIRLEQLRFSGLFSRIRASSAAALGY